jgi:outer membrane lipoprotein-sorting protein
VAAALLTSAGWIVSAVTATARDSLSPRTAAQLLVDVQRAHLDGLSGTVVQTSDLGLPALPGVAGGNSSEFSSLVSGSHTMRVWAADPNQLRIALLGQFGESDLVRNGTDLWTWSSARNAATHVTLPAHDAAGSGGSGTGPTGPLTPDQALTPPQAAKQVLQAIDPTTAVSTDPTAVVAGRPAYQLVLQPRDSGTLIGSIRIAIDGATHVPTRVQVFARGATSPAFEVGFTSFDPTAPSPSVFDFSPPPGATVTQRSLADAMNPGTSSGQDGQHSAPGGAATPQVVGSGWTSVLVAQLPQDSAGAAGAGTPGTSGGPTGASLRSLLRTLPPVSGSWGSGHLLAGTLFSAVLTDDGRVAVGAVPPSALYAALSAS